LLRFFQRRHELNKMLDTLQLDLPSGSGNRK
jgi:hypothetical protein